MAVGAVVARILTQYSDKGSKAAQKDLMKLGKNFDAYAKRASRAVGLVAVATAAAAVKIGKDSVMAASDVSQQFGALDAVFGSNSIQLKNFSKTMVEYGLSTADAARFAALLGTQLTGLGLTQQDAIERTQKLQILAADLAATYGGTTADAVAALSSTFKGEYNPIERYGVAIRKSDITARVAAKGLKGLTGEALKAAEAQAAYELILTKTTAAQGQSGREFNTLAAQLQRLNASYTNIQASLGEALLPVIQEFAQYLLKDVVPGIQKWVDLNKTQLGESLKTAAKLAGNLLKVAFKIGAWASDNLGKVKAIAIAIAGIFVVAKAVTFFATVLQMITTLKALKLQADLTNASTSRIGLVGKVGVAAGVAAVVIPGYQAIMDIAQKQLDQTKNMKDLEKQLFNAQLRRDPIVIAMVKKRIEALKVEIALTEKLKRQQEKFVGKGTIPYLEGMMTPEQYKALQKEIAKTTALEKAAAAAAAKAAAAALVADKKDAALKAVIAKGQAALKKFGITTKEEDPIQLEAARLNLVKQGNIAEAARIATIGKNLALQLEANKALSRYNDLLAALADSKISSEEVLLLSKKWGMTIEATQSYIQTLLAVADSTISDDEVTNLAKAWGVSKDKAAMYLDFFNFLNDGKLSDAEIVKLQTKWGLTSKEVGIYAGVITAASDYVISDAEIIALGKNWGLTTAEVIAYILKLGQPVTFSGTLVDPATQATLGWKNATAALAAYQAALGNKAVTPPVVVPPTVTPPTVTPPTVTPQGPCGTARPYYNYYTGECVATQEEIKPRGSTSSTTTGTIGTTTSGNTSVTGTSAVNPSVLAAQEAVAAVVAAVNPSVLAAQESGAIGAASIATQLRAAEEAQEAAIAAAKQASSLAAFKEKEARDLAAARALAADQDYDEKFRIRSAQGVMSATASSSSQAPVVVNLTVQGSVTTEQDLVQTLRTGLLRGQYNGQSITLEAI